MKKIDVTLQLYDEELKVTINEEEKEKIVSRLPMLRMMPTFTN